MKSFTPNINTYDLYTNSLHSNFSDFSLLDYEPNIANDTIYQVDDDYDLQYISPFYQVDGVDDLFVFSAPPSGHIKPGRAYSAPPNSSLKLAPFKLNQRKQTQKLKQDSLLTDFEIVVSPTEQSVSFLCSTGFYTLVVVPAFAHTFVGTTHQVGDISISCYDVTGKIDDIAQSCHET